MVIPFNLFKNVEFFLPKFVDMLRNCVLDGNMCTLDTLAFSCLPFFYSAKRKAEIDPKIPRVPKLPKVSYKGFLHNTREEKLPTCLTPG